MEKNQSSELNDVRAKLIEARLIDKAKICGNVVATNYVSNIEDSAQVQSIDKETANIWTKEIIEITQILGLEIFNKIEDKTNVQEILEEGSKQRTKRTAFTFADIGIQPGEKVRYIGDSSIVATVIDDRYVCYNGRRVSLSRLASELTGKNRPLQGTLYFTYMGEVIADRRIRLEKGTR